MPKSELSEREFFALIENIIKPENNSEAISFLKSLHRLKDFDKMDKWELQNQPFLSVKAKFKGYKIRIYRTVIEDNYIKQFDIQLSREYTLFKSFFQ